MAIGGNNQTLSVTIGANMDPSGVLSAVKQMQSAFSGLKLPGDIGADLEKSFGKATDLLKKYQTQLSKGINTKTDAKNITKTGSQINEVLDEIVTHINSINGQQIFLKADVSGLNTLKTNIENARTAWKNAIQEFRKGSDIEKVLNEIAEKTTRSGLTQGSISSAKTLFDKGDLEGYRNALDDIYNRLKNLKDTTIKNVVENLGLQDAGSKIANLDQIKKRLEDISKIDFSGDSNVDTKFKAITTAVTEYETEVKRASQAGQNAFNNINVDKTVKDTRDLVDATDQYKNSVMSAKDQVQQLQQSTQYFFSLRNMINLLKRGIREAVDVVKELDAAMTETAVVTDYSVGDMWQKLPEYTANANALGATVKDMYEATTLYYQQGLRTEAAMGIANETMKMARIGGLEAADATDKMTAALRGFNMEINEMSAQRVNDVYSNLAAKTASNTEELGTAMQRTASIAHSAGMSFEGTAAFLAQAIETTREPAENLGTAMKTIVARFTELKKNPLEITEVDGEEVSYNKVDTALQSIGVSLKDANGQFRDLDKVFLDISKRWDSLTQTQQRYIATTAAGSRQQSRFIAMMSNYERTMQLMDFANNSAGASTEQFGKTMESLEAKINKLRNAWNEFLMGIMNDKWTKRLVDAGTGILNLVNKIIDKLSFNGELGLVKSFLSIATAFTALKAGGNIINKLIGGLGGLVDPTSSFGKGFWGAGKTTAQGTPATGVAGKITTPIVAKLNELIAVTKGNKEGQIKTSSTVDQYKATNQALRKINGMDMGTISALFGGLSDEHAYMAYKNAPGTTDAMKQAVLGWLGSKKMPADAQKVGQQLMSAIFKGMDKKEISIKDGMKLIGQPQKWGEKFGTDVAWNFSNSFSKELTQQAVEKTWADLGMKLAAPNTKKDYLNDKDLREKFINTFKTNRQNLLNGLDNVSVSQTNFQQLANSVGALGSKFSTAGMSLQIFGAQLGQLSPALQGIGNLLTQVGMAVNTFGMGISGIGSIVTKIGGRIVAGQAAVKYGSAAMAQAVASGAVAAESTVAATGTGAASAFISGFTGGMSAGPIAAIIIGVLTGGIMIAKSIIDKKAKEAGEEVRENFEKGFTETNKKIDSIEGYKDRFNELSKGVDQFGHNISLADEEYDEYLSISRDLQELSPSLIAGYNAEGQAILRKGEAIDEVIDKLKEERDLSLDSYISNDSVEKLIKAYNTSDAYKQHHTTIKDTTSQNTVVSAFDSEKTGISNAIKKAGLEWSDFSQILDELGIGGAASISQLTNTQLGLISDHYIDILNKIKEFNPQVEQEAEEGLKEAFANTNNAIEDVLAEGAPIVDALHQWMGQEKLDAVGLNLSEEFVSGFNSGIEGLMLEGLTNNWKPEEYKSQLKDYANEWKNLAGPTSQYANILSDADEIQQEYLDHIGEDGAIDNYKNNIETTAQKLEQLAAQYKDTGAAGEVFAEQCIEQANALRNYATEGAISLGEALNSLSDEFTAARSAQERFQEATKGGDYYTAAEGYKGIIDTVLDEKNLAGSGSLTFWAGADELLGKDFVDASSYNEVVAQIKKVQDCFADGSEGALAFNDLLVENQDKLKGLGYAVGDDWHFDLQTEDLEKYAKVLGMSEEALASLIDKARQWVPMDLGDPKKIRQALEASETSMSGTSSRGENLLYTSESSFREEARQQGIRGNDYTKTKADAESQGIRFLTVENLTTKNGDGLYADQVLENIGLKGADKTLNNATAALAKMGFDLEDTKQILTADGLKLADGQATAEDVEKAYNENAYALENPTVAGIANDTGVIASAATALLASMGILTDQAKKDIDQTTSDEYTDNVIKGVNQDFTDSASRNAAVSALDSQIEEYDSTLRLLAQGGVTEGEYVDKLTAARQKLIDAKEEEQKAWDTKVSEAQAIIEDKGKNTAEQQYLDANAVDIQNAFNNTNITDAATQLREIEDAGKLSHSTMVQLAADFLKLNQESLANLNVDELDNLCTKLGLTGQEATQLLSTLGTPFVLTGRLEGDDLKAYINEYEGITAEDKTILLRTDISGQEKVELLLDKINNEFGDGTEKTKTIILEAEAKLANGDQEGAEKLLLDAGFDENKVQEITERLSITVDGSVANPGDVQEALTNELSNMNLEAEVKAKVSAKLEVTNQSKVSDTSAKVNYTKGHQDNPDKKSTTVDYTLGKQDLPKTKDAGVNYTWKSQDEPKDKVAYVTYKERARGQNYSIPAHQSISFGSAANGLNLSKKKQAAGSIMTALVGEEGYEVGYIPSEGRSVIFGANGPEMTSFPKDTIIYPHKQSKEILRRGKNNHKTLGSFGGGKDSISSDGLRSSITGKSSTSSSQDTKKQSQDTSKDVKKAAKQIEKTFKDVGDKVYKVTVWWENIARSTQDTQRKMDRAAKDFEKYTKEMQATLKKTGQSVSSGGGGGDDYIKNIQAYKQLNEQQKNRANLELNALETSGLNRKAKQKQLKKEYKKGNIAVEEVSYKKKGKSKTDYVDLSKYIKNGQVDEKALKNITNSAKRKAVAEAASKALNDERSKRNSAEDNIIKAQEALEKMGEELYNTFFKWEVELTRIWNLTKQIEATEKNISRAKTFQETLDKQLSTGRAKYNDPGFAQKSMAAFNTGLSESINKIHAQMELVDQQKKTLQDTLSIEDEKTTLAAVQAKLNQRAALDKTAEQKKTALNQAQAKLNDAKQRQAAKEQTIKDLKKKKKNASKSKKSKIQKQIDAAEKELKNIKNEVNTYTQQVNNANAAYQSALTAATNNLSDTEKLGYENYRDALQDQIKAQTEAKKYLTITQNGDGTVSVDFDTEKFEAEKLKGNITEEQGKAIQDYVKEITDNSAALSDAYQSANASINELYDELEQLQNEWVDYANELWDIHDKEVKERTDNLKKLSDSINKALKKLLDDVKRKLDERRQQEDNRKTELDISQKQQRLAMLQADTSGGHQVEIAQLQKEIAEAQQNYQRSLEDQLLDKLQQQADLAAEQRERQIELEEEISEGVNNAALVDMWMENPEEFEDDIYEAFKKANDYDKKPKVLQEDLDRKFGNLMDGLTTNQKKQEAVNKAIDSIEDTVDKIRLSLALMTANISTAKDVGLTLKEAHEYLGASYKDLGDPNKGKYTIQDFIDEGISYADAKQAFAPDKLKEYEFYREEATKDIIDTAKLNLDKAWKAYYYSNQQTVDNYNKALATAQQLGIDTSQYDVAKLIAEQKSKEEAERAAQAVIDTVLASLRSLTNSLTLSARTQASQITAIGIRYATGGLADFNGPAWLDGTPSKPELVLNPQDTQNFLALRDVLSKAIGSTNSIDNTYGGDNIFEINVNVDKIEKDYDVDRVIEKVKKEITKGAGYRNVTQVRNFR